jgi:hypothetical protein
MKSRRIWVGHVARIEELSKSKWRERKEAESGVQSVLDCTKQNTLASINEHNYKAPEKFSCSEVLDRASNSPDPPKKIGKGSQNMSRFYGSKGPQMDDHNTLSYKAPTNCVRNAVCKSEIT